MSKTIRFFIPCMLCLALLIISGCGGGDKPAGGGGGGTSSGGSGGKFNEAAIPALSAAEQAETEEFITKHGKDTVSAYLEAFVVGYTDKKPDIRYVKHFISKGGDVNAKGMGDVTPLHHAVRLDLEITKYLVSKGANVNVKHSRNMTPLDMLMMGGDPEIRQYLQSIGAKSGRDL